MNQLPESQDPAWQLLKKQRPVTVTPEFAARLAETARFLPQDAPHQPSGKLWLWAGGLGAAAAAVLTVWLNWQPVPALQPLTEVTAEILPDHVVLLTDAELEQAWTADNTASSISTDSNAELFAVVSYEQTLAVQDVSGLSDNALLALMVE